MPKKIKSSKLKKFKKPTFAPKPVVEVITLSDTEDSKEQSESETDSENAPKRFKADYENAVEYLEANPEDDEEHSEANPENDEEHSEANSEDSVEHSEVEIIEESLETINISESSDDEGPSIEVITLDACVDDTTKKCKRCTGFCPHVETLDYIPIPMTKIKYKGKTSKRKPNGFPVDIISAVAAKTRVKHKFLKAQRYQPYKNVPSIQLSHPNIGSKVEKPTNGLRPIVIDGPNVAFAYGNGEFKARGIIEMIEYFSKRGHEEIVCFLPAHYKYKCRTPDEHKILSDYEKKGFISYTPSRKLIDGQQITPYDDRFVIDYAHVRKGVIISNDGYRDLLGDDSAWKETIEKKIINFTFARGLLMLPRDPLGPHGPSLDEMLKLSKEELSLM